MTAETATAEQISEELAEQVNTNSALIEQATKAGISPEGVYLMTGLEILITMMSPDVARYQRIKLAHERAFGEQLAVLIEQRKAPALLIPGT